MSGTKEGGEKASKTNKRKYGEDFFKTIGSQGGKKGRTGGFWFTKHVLGNEEAIRAAGRKGGAKSRRGKAKHE